MTEPSLTAQRWHAIEDTQLSAQQALLAHTTSLTDEYVADPLADPAQAHAELRAAGFTVTADRLVELFGPEWRKRTAEPIGSGQ